MTPKGIGAPALIHVTWVRLCQWGWILSVTLSCAGLLLAVLTDDHRLASRSAALLVAIALMSLQDLLG